MQKILRVSEFYPVKSVINFNRCLKFFGMERETIHILIQLIISCFKQIFIIQGIFDLKYNKINLIFMRFINRYQLN